MTIVLIPTLNEEDGIGLTIDDVNEYAPDSKILVVDSYSEDKTRWIAYSKGAAIVNAPKGGKGLAIRYALSNPECTASPYLIMMDGDYTYPAQYIVPMIEQLENGADVVIGYRHDKEHGAMCKVHSFGNSCLSILASLLYGYRVKDLCSGMWGFRTEALKGFTITSKRFTLEADLFVNAIQTHCRLSQVPISYRARLSHSVAKLQVSDGFKIGWFLIKRRFNGRTP
jgi:glycosyltransferase involved in cell wall biosynthesis